MLVEIEEVKIKSFIEMHQNTIPELCDHFSDALNIGAEFREAGLNPFYVYNDQLREVLITSLEHMQNRLN